MSWTSKNVQDCEMDGGEQLRQNSTAKARRQPRQFGWNRRHVKYFINTKNSMNIVFITQEVLGGKVKEA